MSRGRALCCGCLLAVHGVQPWRGMVGGHAWRATAGVRPCCAGNPYADEHGAFGDNVFRYTLLSLAACEAPLQLNIGGYRQEWLDVLPAYKWACLCFCACQLPPDLSNSLGLELGSELGSELGCRQLIRLLSVQVPLPDCQNCSLGCKLWRPQPTCPCAGPASPQDTPTGRTACLWPTTGMQPWCPPLWLQSIGGMGCTKPPAACWPSTTCRTRGWSQRTCMATSGSLGTGE